MRPFRFLPALFFLLGLLAACAPRNAWTTYAVPGFPSNEDPSLLPYSFEYPADWTIREENDHIQLVSQKKLLQEVPDKLKHGQILVSLSTNINMPPEEMIRTRAEQWKEIIHFNDLISTDLDGRPYAYREGVQVDSNDQIIVLAVDLGRNMRALLTARMAEGEIETWRETLMSVAKSLQLEP